METRPFEGFEVASFKEEGGSSSVGRLLLPGSVGGAGGLTGSTGASATPAVVGFGRSCGNLSAAQAAADTSSRSSGLYDFDPVVPTDDAKQQEVAFTVKHRPRHLTNCGILVVALVVYMTWLVSSVANTCDSAPLDEVTTGQDGMASPFWWYLLVHAGFWFWVSIIAMSCLFDLMLHPYWLGEDAGGASPAGTACRATLCAALGLATGGSGLYFWHVHGDRMVAGLYENIISKAIIMACVGLFGVVFTAILCYVTYYTSKGWRRSFFWFLLGDGLWPIIICCVWCIVWLLAEVVSQCFPAYVALVEKHLPRRLVPVAETLYVEIYSVVMLPTLRLALGPLERRFLPRGNRGDRDEEFAHSIRGISWVDLLFEGFRWQYNRIVFAKAQFASVILVSLYHITFSAYGYYWKYCPHRTAARIGYWVTGCRKPPPWSKFLAERPLLQRVVRILTNTLSFSDVVSAHIFSSTFFVLSMSSSGGAGGASAGPMRLAACDKEFDMQGLRCVATLSILNHRVLIAREEDEEGEWRKPCAKPCPLELTDTFAASQERQEEEQNKDLSVASTQVSSDCGGSGGRGGGNDTQPWLGAQAAKEAVRTSMALASVNVCALVLQQQIELRLGLRQCVRLFSSLALLSTNLILGAFDSHLVRDPVGSLDFFEVRVWLVPLVMVMADLFEVFCMWHTYRGWLFSPQAVRRWRIEVLGKPVFLLSLFCLLLHLSMSPTFGRHALRFCI